VSQPWILTGEQQSSLLTRIAAMESPSFCARTKSWRRLSNSNQQSGGCTRR
jgi:hypothetical protein